MAEAYACAWASAQAEALALPEAQAWAWVAAQAYGTTLEQLWNNYGTTYGTTYGTITFRSYFAHPRHLEEEGEAQGPLKNHAGAENQLFHYK